MLEKTTLTIVTEILVEQLAVKPEQCIPDARLDEDLGADSLDCVEVCMGFEEELGVDIPDTVLKNIKTVRDWVTQLDLIRLPQPNPQSK